MSLFTKEALAKILAGTTLVGGIAWGTAVWSGSNDLQSIKDSYNNVKTQYDTAMGNISIYKTELLRRAGIISDSQAKADILAAKVKQLEAQLENAQNGSTADQATIAELRNQITTLQTQIDNGITEEDFNSVLQEVERLQGELAKANKEVADLKAYIDGQDASVKEVTAVTAEDVQNDVDVQNLYYTWQLDNGSADGVTAYLNGLNIVDERNESPIAMSKGLRNTYSIGNARAFKKLYDKQNGQGAFDTAYNANLASYVASYPDDPAADKFVNAINSLTVTVSVDGTSYTIRFSKNVPLTPNGEVKDYNYWIDDNANINF